jgi:hypothetical protein
MEGNAHVEQGPFSGLLALEEFSIGERFDFLL